MNQFLTLKDHVYNHIAGEITAGKLRPGEKVNEMRISKELNISRTPVREALIQLSAEGFLENLPRKGFVIKKMNLEEAVNIYEIIGLLDGAAAGLSCPLLGPKHLEDMSFYIDSCHIAIQKENYDMYYKSQEAFHNVYLGLCPNQTMVGLLNQLKKKFLKKTYHDNQEKSIQNILLETNEEHKKILLFFQAKKSKEANDFLREVHWARDKAQLESF